MSLVLWVLLAVVLAWGVFVFNRLVRLRNQVRAGWSDIDVQLMRRHDLVPRLVEAVRAYAGHEKALLENVAELRGRAMASRSPAELAGLEASLEQGLGRLFLLQEAYPDLKASENFLALQRDLVEVEDHLQYARRFYNGAARALNDAVLSVPDLLIARSFGFREAEYFEASDAASAAVKVSSFDPDERG
ncbi:MAG TPA: LemA family protein [Arenimonas sp.]|nr:LemA family protein [Arenimonas sp.]